MIDWTVRPPEEGAEMARLTAVLGTCFLIAPDAAERWLSRSARENLRVVRNEAGVAGGMCLVPMGQSFGGAVVPMTGVAGVGIAPEARGKGAAQELIAQMLRAEHANGLALSVLYPATETLYRLGGYETAGSRFLVECNVEGLALHERRPGIRRIAEDDADLIRGLHERFVTLHPGNLLRGEYIWRRVTERKDGKVDGYVLEDGGGYVYLWQQHVGNKFVVRVEDLVAFTHPAARRLLSFLGDHRSMHSEVRWNCGPNDPFVNVLPENAYELRLDTHWMLRVVNVKAALEARGYSAGLSAEVHLRVRDDVVPGNDGPWILRVADGRGTVEPGGRGSVDVDVRGLAALYSGFAAPASVTMRGQLDGPPDETALLASAFAGPAPWMREYF